MLSEGTCSFIAAKRMMAAIATTHPMSAAHTKVQTFKHSVATIVLVNAKTELRSGGLAIQGKV